MPTVHATTKIRSLVQPSRPAGNSASPPANGLSHSAASPQDGGLPATNERVTALETAVPSLGADGNWPAETSDLECPLLSTTSGGTVPSVQ